MGLQSAKMEKGDKEISTANQVEKLIKEATNPSNLVGVIVYTFSEKNTDAGLARARCTWAGQHGCNIMNCSMISDLHYYQYDVTMQ